MRARARGAARGVRHRSRSCRSLQPRRLLLTAALRRWLEERRSELEQREGALPRPGAGSGEASEAIEERATDVQEVFERLVNGLPEDRSAWGPVEQARWLLAHQLDYFRREDRCAWWEFFRIHELDHEELLEERKGVSRLEFVGGAGGTARCPVHRYRFPAQEAALNEGDELHEIGGEAVGTVSAIDQVQCTLDIKKRANAAEHHPSAVFVNEHVRPAAGRRRPPPACALCRRARRGRGRPASRRAGSAATESAAFGRNPAGNASEVPRGHRCGSDTARPQPRSWCARDPGTTGVGKNLHRSQDDRRSRRRGDAGRRHGGEPQGDPEFSRGDSSRSR